MTIGAYFESKDLDRVVSALSQLPGEFRPADFGVREQRPSAGHLISSKARFRRFLAEHPEGFFLFAPRCRYNFTPGFRSGFGTVFVDHLGQSLDDEGASVLHGALAGTSEFSFACQRAERDRRNRVAAELGNAAVEAWVGRDLGKYVPGIYWLTSASPKVVSRFSLASLPDELAGGLVRIDAGGGLRARMGEASRDWRQWSERVGAVCRQHPGLFSADEVLRQIASAPDLLTLEAVLGPWP